MKELPTNTYAGDLGEVLPRTAKALELNREPEGIGEAQVQLCRALAVERLVVPAPLSRSWSPQDNLYAAPGGTNAEKTFDNQAHSSESGCSSASLHTVFSPVGSAVLAYSSAEVFGQRENPASRPVLMSAQRVALDALTESGRLWLDPEQIFVDAAQATQAFHRDLRAGGGIILGRPALTALASADEWLAPWDDPEIPDLLRLGLGNTGVEYRGCSPLPGAGLAVEVQVDADLTAARVAVARAQAGLARIEALSARTGFLQLRPVS